MKKYENEKVFKKAKERCLSNTETARDVVLKTFENVDDDISAIHSVKYYSDQLTKLRRKKISRLQMDTTSQMK
jgi:hypothetical protein